ncbi:ABC transporter permease [Dawidia soli]|uniref:ABC transporter permease n=1 Tax=Dawidia soli TaxID=2782352 RepID=A0AAP2GDB2_9BACT|nr:ABC transporter permease [Dawidia soli]MBT1687184.1 ABC transporter permease [Dawidia soli]
MNRKPFFNGAIIANYFLSSYRHVLRDKVNSTFKIAGLTLAIFSLMVVTLYLAHQLSFDRYHPGYERIYRVNTQRLENGHAEQYGIAPFAFGSMLKTGFPDLETSARLGIFNGSHLRVNDRIVYGGVFSVDSTWFDIFRYTFIKGSPKALTRPGTIVLTETLSKKLFGEDDPMQKLLTVNNEKTLYEVAAVIKDIPTNSHIRVDAFVPIHRADDFTAQQIISPVDFVENSTVLFVKLHEHSDPARVASQLEAVVDQHIGKKQRLAAGFNVSLQPLEDIYLAAPLKYEFARKGSMVYLYVFLILGLFLFAISCINYVNLSLAGFVNRSREMGVRKVMGGRRSQIVVQVALDTGVYVLGSFAISVAMLYLLFPKIQQYIDPDLPVALLTSRAFMMTTGGLLLAITVIATVIPAGWFAANTVVNDLKGIYARAGKMKFNDSLLLAQFVISIICIGATLTVSRQIDFIHSNDLGINRKDLLVLTMTEDFTTQKMIALKSALKSVAGVTHVSNSSFRIGGGYWKDWYSVQVGEELRAVELYEVFSDDELFETLGMKVLQGRVFDDRHKADSGAAFVINETAARALGLTNPVGTRILTHPEEPGKWEGTIVGVVNDINISTLHHKVQPLVMRLPWQNQYPEYFVYVRIEGDAGTIVPAIRKKYQELQPGYPLEVVSVDDFYNQEYKAENRAYASLQVGTSVILLISALGIFSLSAYLSVRKMKEFGIRKVMGASVGNIAGLHVFHILRVALAAVGIGLPVVYFLMDEWLGAFAYRIQQTIASAAVVIAITGVLVLVSAGYAALRAGMVNPVKVINKV